MTVQTVLMAHTGTEGSGSGALSKEAKDRAERRPDNQLRDMSSAEGLDETDSCSGGPEPESECHPDDGDDEGGAAGWEASGDGAGLKEWAAMHHLMLQIPAKYQNLLAQGELQLTSVSAVDDFILLGSNTGSVYWYDSVSCTMQRYRREGQLNPVSRVCAVTSSDHLLVAGHRSGELSAFVVPRLARGDVPEYVRITEMNIKKNLQFGVSSAHDAPVTALCCSQNADRVFSGDEAGVVSVTEIDYITESVVSRVLLREPSPVVQLRYLRQCLLVATRARCLVWRWPHGPASQVGTKPRKTPGELGACFVEDSAGGVAVLAARSALKVVTANLSGSVGATVSLKPTLEGARPVQLLYPVRAHSPAAGVGPGLLMPLSETTVALYDRHCLLVVDTARWEILHRCDRLPAVLDVAAAGGAIFVLCSPRRLIRLGAVPDDHPAICENLRLANGDLSLEEVLQDLKSAVPVTQVKSMLHSVSGQLERAGVFDKLSSTSDAVSSLKARMGSLMALGLGGSRPPPPRQPSARVALGSSSSSPDVRRPPAEDELSPPVSAAPSPASSVVEVAAAPAPAVIVAVTVVDTEPIARQVKVRRRPGRRRRANCEADTRSLDTVSLGGEAPAARTPGEADPLRGAQEVAAEGADSEVAGTMASVAINEGNGESKSESERTCGELEGSDSRERVAVPPPPGRALPDPAAAEDAAASVFPLRPPAGPLDFTQFYPSDVRPRLRRTDSELSDEAREKELQLAALLGLEDLSVAARPPSPGGSTPSQPSPPARDTAPGQNLGLNAETSLETAQLWGRGPVTSVSTDPSPDKAEEPTPTPSYSSLFPFNKPPLPLDSKEVPPPAELPASEDTPRLDSETGEPMRPQPVHVQHADAAVEADAVDAAGEEPEDVDGGWRPWLRQLAPSFVSTLSACSRYAVLTDPEGRVYWTDSEGQTKWELLDYKAAQVAVSFDGRRVWRLDSAGLAYALADPEPGRPRGAHWVKAARDVVQLAADAAAVWYIKRGGKLFVQRDLWEHRCAAPEVAVDVPEPLIHVTARDGVVWAVTAKGSVLWRVGVSRAHQAGLSWESLATGALQVHAAYLGSGSTGWLLDARARLHFITGVSADLPRGVDGVWRRVLGLRSGGSAGGRQVAAPAAGAALRASVAVEGGVAWFAEPAVMNVLSNRYRITGVRWEQYTPRGRELAWSEVHASGLYQRRGQLWTVARGQLYGGDAHDGLLKPVALPVRGCQLQCLSAAPGALWLLSTTGEVYVREGVEQRPRGTDWAQLDLLQIDRCRLTHLSVGAQSVWACDAQGRVLIRLGPTVARRSPTALQPAWVTLDSPGGVHFVQVHVSRNRYTAHLERSQVCVGPGDVPVWALDDAGLAWRRAGVSQQLLVGTHWQAAPGVAAAQLAVAPCGVWARARSGAVHRWLESERQWCRVPGSTKQLSASVSGELWVVHGGGLYTLQTLAVAPGRPLEPRIRRLSSLAAGEDPDWEHVTY